MPDRIGAHRAAVPKRNGECLTGGLSWGGTEGWEEDDRATASAGPWAWLTMQQPGGPSAEGARGELRGERGDTSCWRLGGGRRCLRRCRPAYASASPVAPGSGAKASWDTWWSEVAWCGTKASRDEISALYMLPSVDPLPEVSHSHVLYIFFLLALFFLATRL